MTTYRDGELIKVDWCEDERKMECSQCIHYSHTFCDNPSSDHYCHVLHLIHPACNKFEEL